MISQLINVFLKQNVDIIYHKKKIVHSLGQK